MTDTDQEWNDGYILEAADRCHTIMVMMEELLRDHPAILKINGGERLESATDIIMDLYQEVWTLDKDRFNNEM